MKNNKLIRRIVPNIYSNDLEKSKQFYTGFLEMELAKDMEWILTFVSKEKKKKNALCPVKIAILKSLKKIQPPQKMTKVNLRW